MFRSSSADCRRFLWSHCVQPFLPACGHKPCGSESPRPRVSASGGQEGETVELAQDKKKTLWLSNLLSVRRITRMLALKPKPCKLRQGSQNPSQGWRRAAWFAPSLQLSRSDCQANSKADTSNLNQTISDFQPKVSKCAQKAYGESFSARV